MSRKRTQTISERVTWGESRSQPCCPRCGSATAYWPRLHRRNHLKWAQSRPTSAYEPQQVVLRYTPSTMISKHGMKRLQAPLKPMGITFYGRPHSIPPHNKSPGSMLNPDASRRVQSCQIFLNAAGAPYWGVHQTILVTTVAGDEPLQELIEEAKSAQSATHHFGIAELLVDNDASLRIICMLAAKETFTLKPIPRRLKATEAYRIVGHLTAEYREPSVLAMGPSGHIHRIEPNIENEQFAFTFSGEPGVWVVEIIATGQARSHSTCSNRPLRRTENRNRRSTQVAE